MNSSDNLAYIVFVVSCGVRIMAYWTDALWLGHNCCEGSQPILLFESLSL